MKDSEEYQLGYADGLEAAQRQQEGIDWEAFRAEAAKDILCAKIMRGERQPFEGTLQYAVAAADRLVHELKQTKPKAR